MYNDNLVLDYDNNIKIPSNENSFYKIEGNSFLCYTINIFLTSKFDLDLLNLFIILKSYSSSVIYIPHNLLTIIKNPEESFFLANVVNISVVKKMSYWDFYVWYNAKVEKEWMYVRENGLYIFSFTYPIDIFDRNLVPIIKPKYPWNSLLLQNSVDLYEKKKMYNDLLMEKDKKISELELELEKLRKK